MRRHAEATGQDFVNIHATSSSAPRRYGQVIMQWSSITDASSALDAAQSPTTPRLGACCAFTPRLGTSDECPSLLPLPPSFSFSLSLSSFLSPSPAAAASDATASAQRSSSRVKYSKQILLADALLLAPHTSGPRDVPRCGALSLLQKEAALQGGIQQKPL
jgi:hypothetical protein